MEPDGKNFGRGPREPTGSIDLVSQYKLLAHHKFFCKRSLPLSISDTHYLHNVVGDTEIRKGEGMELDQLFKANPYSIKKETTSHIKPFDLISLGQAFPLRETAPIDLPSVEKGVPTINGKSKSESRDKDRKHKNHKDKDKEHKKHKHRHKDKNKDKEKKDGDHSKKHHDKKRKRDSNEDPGDLHKRCKSKHNSLMIG